METFVKGFCFRENKMQAKTLTPALLAPLYKSTPLTAAQRPLWQDGGISPAAAVRHSSQSQAWPEIKSVVFHAWETKVFDLQAKFPL